MLKQAHIQQVFNSRSVSGDVDEESKLLVYGIFQMPAGAWTAGIVLRVILKLLLLMKLPIGEGVNKLDKES